MAQWFREAELEIGEIVTMLPTDLENIAKAFRVEEDEVGAPSLDYGIRDDCRRVEKQICRGDVQICLLLQLANAIQDGLFGSIRCREDFCCRDFALLTIQQNEIRECAADIDG